MTIEKKDIILIARGLGYKDKTKITSSNLKSLVLDNCKLKGSTDLLGIYFLIFPFSYSAVIGVLLSSLEYLSMKNNKFNSVSGSDIADILRQDETQERQFAPLKTLDLRSNEIKKGVADISDALAVNPVLTTLSLRDNKLEETDLVDLIRGLVCHLSF